MTTPSGLPRLAVFSLGGTIASTNDPHASGEVVVPRLGASELAAAVPQLQEVAELETIAFRQSASGDLTLPDLVELAAEITARFATGVTGAIVTQGTDTIEETAFALDLLVDSSCPVVVTGAMRNPTLAGPDGPANLLAAAQVAVSQNAVGCGCVVVLNDEIHAARFVSKTNTSSPSAFRSMTTGPLGWIVEGEPRIASRLAALRHLSPLTDQAMPAVALLKVTLGDDGRLVGFLESAGYAGLVLEGFGGGHVTQKMVGALAQLAEKMPVVLASRTGSGTGLKTTYGFSGSERDLLSRGLISSGFLDGLKSRILLSLLLASGADGEGIRRGFEEVDATTR